MQHKCRIENKLQKQYIKKKIWLYFYYNLKFYLQVIIYFFLININSDL